MQSEYDYEIDIFDEDITKEAFSFKESMRARVREIKHSISLLRKSLLFILGFFAIIFLVLLAVFAPIIANYGANEFAIDDLIHVNYIKEPPGAKDKVLSLLWSDMNNLTENFDFSRDEVIRSSLTDLNNDSLIDLLIGTNARELYFLENIGSDDPKDPNEWVLNDSYLFPSIPENITGWVSPTAGDINSDNVTDIIIGGNNGRLYLSYNNGTPSSPIWTDFEPVIDGEGAEIVFPSGEQVNPTLIDYNQDGLIDLVVGSTDYLIHIYINEARWYRDEVFELSQKTNMPKDISERRLTLDSSMGNGSLRINFMHINPDNKYWDMIVIFESGDFEYFTGYSIVSNPNYQLLDKSESSVRFDFPEVEEEPFIDFHLYDFTDDNRTDIIKFRQGGRVLYAYQYVEEDGRIHYFGTDQQGGDIFSRCIWALQTDLILAIWVVTVAIVIGTIVGAIAGYFGGWVDQLIMRITDIFFAFPGLILAMAISAALGRSMLNLSIALIVVWWAGYARIARGQVLSEKSRLYVEAARALGLSDTRIIFRHILPNTIYPLLVAATLDLGGVVLTAAGLSFIGFGANPGDAELGRMIADGRDYFINSPWLVFFPGFFIFLIVMAFNLIGDGLRDVMDPKLRR